MAGYLARKSLARRAKAAEAAGDLPGAAKLWAEAGERGKVGACWIRLAERALSDEDRIAALRTAIEHLDGPDDAADRRGAEVRLAQILLARARLHGIAGARERELCEEAAQRFEAAEETLAAGAAYEILGRPEDAARAYEKGGHVEALERVLSDDQRRTSETRQIARRFDEYRLALAGGARDRALEAIRVCATLGPASGGYREMLADLEARFPPRARVVLDLDGATREIVGRPDGVVLGRGEADVPLRNLDVSRRHVEIKKTNDGWVVEDLRSRSGTTLDGLALGAPMKLPARGRIGIGPTVLVAFEAADGHLDLEIVDGLDRGRRMTVLAAPMPIEGMGRSLGFRGARAVLGGTTEVKLSGSRTAEEIVLLVGDVVEGGGRRLEVKRG